MENIQEKYQLLDLTVVNSRYKVSRCRLSNHRQQPSADHLWTLDDQYISYCCGSIFSLILHLARRPITTIASLLRRLEADGLHRSYCSLGKSERKRPPQPNLELHRLNILINDFKANSNMFDQQWSDTARGHHTSGFVYLLRPAPLPTSSATTRDSTSWQKSPSRPQSTLRWPDSGWSYMDADMRYIFFIPCFSYHLWTIYHRKSMPSK